MIRKVEIEGEACSTCKHAELRFYRYDTPWYSCAKHKSEVIDTPDELVCDRFEHMP